MKERICGLFCFLFLGFPGLGQAIHLKTNPAGLHAGVYQKDFADAFSFCENQALLASSRHFICGIYSERKYLIEELQYVTGSISFPALTGGLGFLIRHFGFSGFNESNVGVSYGRALGKWMDIGIQFNYHFVEASGYGSAFSINAELGFIFHLSDYLHVGISIYNPGGSKWSGNSNENLAASFKTGFGYLITNEFYLQLDLIKEEDQQADFQAAIHCQFVNRFFGILGIDANDFSPFGSAGWGWKKMRLYINVSHHPQLGFTPGISLQFGNFCTEK